MIDSGNTRELDAAALSSSGKKYITSRSWYIDGHRPSKDAKHQISNDDSLTRSQGRYKSMVLMINL
jgi:hypothetical protein